MCKNAAKSRRQCASDKGAAGRLLMQVKLTSWIKLHRRQHDLDGRVRGVKRVVRGLGRVSALFSVGEREAQRVAGQNIGGLLARH